MAAGAGAPRSPAYSSGGSLWWTARRYCAAIAAIEAEIASGRFAIAARDLAKLLAWKPDSDEAAYLLGTCEQGGDDLTRPRARLHGFRPVPRSGTAQSWHDCGSSTTAGDSPTPSSSSRPRPKTTERASRAGRPACADLQ